MHDTAAPQQQRQHEITPANVLTSRCTCGKTNTSLAQMPQRTPCWTFCTNSPSMLTCYSKAVGCFLHTLNRHKYMATSVARRCHWLLARKPPQAIKQQQGNSFPSYGLLLGWHPADVSLLWSASGMVYKLTMPACSGAADWRASSQPSSRCSLARLTGAATCAPSSVAPPRVRLNVS